MKIDTLVIVTINMYYKYFKSRFKIKVGRFNE